MRIEDLEVGSVVRLKSGSPKMTVTGFSPVRQPASTQPPTHVSVELWSDRLGFVKASFTPAVLVFPSAPRPADAPPPAEPEGDT